MEMNWGKLGTEPFVEHNSLSIRNFVVHDAWVAQDELMRETILKSITRNYH